MIFRDCREYGLFLAPTGYLYEEFALLMRQEIEVIHGMCYFQNRILRKYIT